MLNSKTVFLNLTTRCNLRCAKCWRYQIWGKGNDIEYDVLQKFKEMFKGFRGQVIVGSGENLIAKYLEEYINWVNAYNVSTTILTTGLKLDKFIDKEYYFSKNIKWGVTLDGFYQEDICSIQKGMVIDRVKNNLKNIKNRYPSSNFYLNITHTTANLKDTTKFIEFAHELNIRDIYFTQLKLFEGLDDSLTKNLVNDVKCNEFISIMYQAEQLSKKYGIRCYAPINQKSRLCFECRNNNFSPIIDINGDISFCYGRNDTVIGNILNDYQAWRILLENLSTNKDAQESWCKGCHASKRSSRGYYFIPKEKIIYISKC